MAYRTLKSIFHQRDRDGAEAEERARRASPAAIEWGLRVGEYEMFALMTPEVAVLVERIMAYESRIRSEWDGLPTRARDDYLDAMIIDEIQATNEIEQVRSTRREISEALRALEAEQPAGSKRFIEMVRLYLDIGRSDAQGPQTLDDIRAVYDAVTADEVDAGDRPDGERFRAGPVSIESGTRVVHRGLVPESAIDEALTSMVAQGRDESIPLLVRAVIAHFVFEYAHPFYDGNGRTGRYLLALELRRVLAPYASLALSATIADNKDRYYRAFADAEDPLNRGDLTPFLIVMLELIAQAQGRLLIDLTDRRQKIEGLDQRLQAMVGGGLAAALGLPESSSMPIDADDIATMLFVLGQAWHFDVNRAVRLQTFAEATGRSIKYVRPRLGLLDDEGVVETVTKNPLRFRLAPRGVSLLGLDRLDD